VRTADSLKNLVKTRALCYNLKDYLDSWFPRDGELL